MDTIIKQLNQFHEKTYEPFYQIQELDHYNDVDIMNLTNKIADLGFVGFENFKFKINQIENGKLRTLFIYNALFELPQYEYDKYMITLPDDHQTLLKKVERTLYCFPLERIVVLAFDDTIYQMYLEWENQGSFMCNLARVYYEQRDEWIKQYNGQFIFITNTYGDPIFFVDRTDAFKYARAMKIHPNKRFITEVGGEFKDKEDKVNYHAKQLNNLLPVGCDRIIIGKCDNDECSAQR